MFKNIFCVLLLSLYLVGENGVLGLPYGDPKAVGGAQDHQVQKAGGGAQDHQVLKAGGDSQDHQNQKPGDDGKHDQNQKPGASGHPDHKQQKDPKDKGKAKGHGHDHKGKGGGKDLAAATCPPQVTVTVDPPSASSSADASTETSSSSAAEATPVNNAGDAESSSSTAAAVETSSSSSDASDATGTTTTAAAAETTSAASADSTASCPATVTVTVDPPSSADASSTATSAAASATDATCDSTTDDSGTDSGSDAGSVVGDADFGICTVPKIEFGAGFDNRKETSFRPTDLVNYNHGSAQNIAIITQFVCDQLVNRCKANQAAKDLCAKAQAAAAAKPPKTGADADAFNEVFGEDTNFSAVQAIDDQGKPIAGSTARRSTKLNILRSRARRAPIRRRQANCVSSTVNAATSTSSASPAATTTSTSSSENLQTFTGALGGIKAPAVSKGGRGLVVEGSDDFLNLAAALGRSCDIQHNQCANLANADRGFSVGECDQQNNDCHAAISA